MIYITYLFVFCFLFLVNENVVKYLTNKIKYSEQISVRTQEGQTWHSSILLKDENLWWQQLQAEIVDLQEDLPWDRFNLSFERLQLI